MTAKTITDAKTSFEEYVKDVRSNHSRIVLHQDTIPVAALISLDDLKLLEDIEDLIDISEARKILDEYDKSGDAITLDELKAELGIE